jgi:hypothetical protein
VNDTVFSEEQSFVGTVGSRLIRVLIFLAMVLFLLVDNSTLPVKAKIGYFALLLGLGMGLPLFFLAAKLTVEVAPDALRVRFHPFKGQSIAYDTIKSCEARQYRPIREYGGWGIRHGSNGKALTVKGNMGVQVEFKGGRRLLIGSEKAEELSAAISARLSPRCGVIDGASSST